MKDVQEKNGHLREMISEVLSANETLTLATAGDNCPWVATLIYVFDQDFNLYFLSEKNSRHSQELEKNFTVAVAIHDKTGKMKGLQIQGQARLAPKAKVVKALKLFWRRFPWARDWVSSPQQLLSKTFTTALYMVRPQRICFLDRDRFGSDTRKVLEL